MTPDELTDLRHRVAGRLTGAVGLVTGAGTTDAEDAGVGQAIAWVLAAAGAAVVVVDRDHACAERTAEAVRAAGGIAEVAVGDVTSRADCDHAAERTIERFGRLDFLVNNAAILGAAATLDFDDDDLFDTLNVNLMGAVRMARAAAPHLARGSAIVNIASLGALRTFGKIDYEASKGGLIAITNTLAVQLGPRGIRVNAVCPGQLWTPMGKRRLVDMGMTDQEIARMRKLRSTGVPIQEEGTAWDVGLATLFLAGREARWITGHTLVVDGGQSGVVGYMPDDAG